MEPTDVMANDADVIPDCDVAGTSVVIGKSVVEDPVRLSVDISDVLGISLTFDSVVIGSEVSGKDEVDKEVTGSRLVVDLDF